jgi:hypothetical protein
VAVVILTWAFALYDFNYVYGQWHAIDRISLIAFAALTISRPSFLWLWILQLSVNIAQFSGSPFYYSWTDKRPVIQFAYLAAAFLPLSVVKPKQASTWCQGLLFAALTLWGASYLSTGIAKLEIGWLNHNPPQNLFLAAHIQNNWLPFLSPKILGMLSVFMGKAHLLLMAAVLAIELGAIALPWRRRPLLWITAGFIFLHTTIFALSGVCFWKWTLFDLALIWISRTDVGIPLNLRTGLISSATMLVVIFGSSLDIPLAWYDSPFVCRYEIHAILDDGKSVEVPPARFEPYDLPFAQSRFHFLTSRPVVVDTFGGATKLDTFQAIQAYAGSDLSEEHLNQLLASKGVLASNEKQRQNLRKFLDKYAKQRPKDPFWRSLPFGFPQHIWTFPRNGRPDFSGRKIVDWEVIYTENVIHNGVWTEVHRETIPL